MKQFITSMTAITGFSFFQRLCDRMMTLRMISMVCLTCLSVSHFSRPAQAISLIRDAEIENTLSIYLTPLLQSAGLSPNSVSLFIVRDSNLNAFVAGGQKIFVHTGLLVKAQNASQVIGVLAHETGHIVGGHLVRMKDAKANAFVKQIAGILVGSAAAILTNRGDAAGAVIAGSQEASLRDFLSFTRIQEQAADQVGLELVQRIGLTPDGLLEFFKVLGNQDALLSVNQDPYLRTHPVTQDRVRFIRDFMERNPQKRNIALENQLNLLHNRMRGKLIGFIDVPQTVLRRYPITDKSVLATYARTIAYHRLSEKDRSLYELQKLLDQAPDDPYFLELQAQIHYENGDIPEAIAGYQQALDLLPQNNLIRELLAQALSASDTEPDLARASEHLYQIVNKEPRNANAWRLLGISEGKRGLIGRAELALSESALNRGQKQQALMHAKRAQSHLPSDSLLYRRSEEILEN